jgi:hypothetical protein
LRQTLGKWIIAQSKTRQEWYWYINPPTGKLFQRDGNTFRIHQTLGKSTQFDPKEIGTTTHMPRTAIPVTVTNFTIKQVPRNQHWEAPEQTTEEPDTFDDYYIDQLEDWERNLFRTTGNVRDTKEITTRIITSDKTYMVSEGGMANG